MLSGLKNSSTVRLGSKYCNKLVINDPATPHCALYTTLCEIYISIYGNCELPCISHKDEECISSFFHNIFWRRKCRFLIMLHRTSRPSSFFTVSYTSPKTVYCFHNEFQKWHAIVRQRNVLFSSNFVTS